MAVDDCFSFPRPSSSRTASQRRATLVQVATENSATFLSFPSSSHQSFVPIRRPRTSLSSVRPSVFTTVTPSKSSSEHKRHHSQSRINPILSNPFLNHRKGQLQSAPTQFSTDTEDLCCTSKSDESPSIIDGDIAQEPESSFKTETIRKHIREQEVSDSVDTSKHDYVKLWLDQIRQATCSTTKVFSKRKQCA